MTTTRDYLQRIAEALEAIASTLEAEIDEREAEHQRQIDGAVEQLRLLERRANQADRLFAIVDNPDHGYSPSEVREAEAASIAAWHELEDFRAANPLAVRRYDHEE